MIVVPVNSQSFSAILLDLGTINLSNTFITLNKTNSEGHPAVVDQLEVALTDLTISRIQLNETSEKIHERYLLEPTTFNVAIKRNLSAGWYKDIPDINISGKIQTIKVRLVNCFFIIIKYFSVTSTSYMNGLLLCFVDFYYGLTNICLKQVLREVKSQYLDCSHF